MDPIIEAIQQLPEMQVGQGGMTRPELEKRYRVSRGAVARVLDGFDAAGRLVVTKKRMPRRGSNTGALVTAYTVLPRKDAALGREGEG